MRFRHARRDGGYRPRLTDQIAAGSINVRTSPSHIAVLYLVELVSKCIVSTRSGSKDLEVVDDEFMSAGCLLSLGDSFQCTRQFNCSFQLKGQSIIRFVL